MVIRMEGLGQAYIRTADNRWRRAPHPPWTPAPPRPRGPSWEKNDIYEREYLIGPFLVHPLLAPIPPPPPLLSSNVSLGLGVACAVLGATCAPQHLLAHAPLSRPPFLVQERQLASNPEQREKKRAHITAINDLLQTVESLSYKLHALRGSLEEEGKQKVPRATRSRCRAPHGAPRRRRAARVRGAIRCRVRTALGRSVAGWGVACALPPGHGLVATVTYTAVGGGRVRGPTKSLCT